jgi:hypothetical protein
MIIIHLNLKQITPFILGCETPNYGGVYSFELGFVGFLRFVGYLKIL